MLENSINTLETAVHEFKNVPEIYRELQQFSNELQILKKNWDGEISHTRVTVEQATVAINDSKKELTSALQDYDARIRQIENQISKLKKTVDDKLKEFETSAQSKFNEIESNINRNHITLRDKLDSQHTLLKNSIHQEVSEMKDAIKAEITNKMREELIPEIKNLHKDIITKEEQTQKFVKRTVVIGFVIALLEIVFGLVSIRLLS